MGAANMNHVTLDFAFAPVPEALIRSTLGDKAIRMWAALARHGTDPSNCYPSHARLAEWIGCAARSVQRPLAELEEAGWIERVERLDANGARSSDGYIVRTVAHHRAGTASTSAGPPRVRARGPRASERDERKSLNESNGMKELQLLPTAAPPSVEPDPLDLAAQRLLKAEWERRKAKPTTPFVACLARVREALDAGWTETEIQRALPRVQAWSRAGMDVALAQLRAGERAPERRGESWVRTDDADIEVLSMGRKAR